MQTTALSGNRIALLRGAAVLAFVLGLAPGVVASTRWATLEAIHQLENPSNSRRPGRFGELGPYQFRAEVWHKYSHTPFRYALDRRASDSVAVKHYEWLKSEIERHGMEATPYYIALAWNGGMKAVVGDRAPQAALDYARRAANLAASLQQNQYAYSR